MHGSTSNALKFMISKQKIILTIIYLALDILQGLLGSLLNFNNLHNLMRGRNRPKS